MVIKDNKRQTINNRSPKPSLFVWDTEQVLNYIDSSRENSALNNKDLKTVAVVALYGIKRGSEMVQFHTKNMFGNETENTFGIERWVKHFRQGKTNP